MERPSKEREVDDMAVVMPPEFYNMDCMDGMKQFPDRFFDLAIVDPPYGIGADMYNAGSGTKKDVGTYGTAQRVRKNRLNQGGGQLRDRILNSSNCSWDTTPPPKEYFDELFRVSQNQIIWGGELLRPAAHKMRYHLGQNTAVGKLLPN